MTGRTIDLKRAANSNTYVEDGIDEGDHSGFARFGYIAVAVVFGGFGIWAAFAPLDSGAVASAKVVVETDRKPVQHQEGGIVREILVKETERVRKDQVLFRLQPTQAQASSDTVAKQIDMARAQEARLLAESSNEKSFAFPPELLARRSIPETATAMADQKKQFDERRRSLESQTSIFRTRISQNANGMNALSAQIDSNKGMHKGVGDELALLEPLKEKGLTPNTRVLPLRREKLRLEGEIGRLQAEMARLREIHEENEVQIRLAEQKFREDAQTQLAEVRAKLSDLREKLSVAADVLSRVEVRAPSDGIVQAIKVQAVGAVIKPGDAIAEVVPIGDKLVLSAQINPIDINSVHKGQRAEIKFPAFSRRSAPTIFGHLDTVSADSFEDPATKQSFFRARIVIDASSIPADLVASLTPGMPADVVIIRGERSALDYIIGPLKDAIWKAGRDR